MLKYTNKVQLYDLSVTYEYLKQGTSKSAFTLLISQPYYSKETSQWDGSIEHPKNMFRTMGK